MGLHTVGEIKSVGIGAYWAESARLIASSIVGRSQAPKTVNVTDLFYLGGIDVGSINIPYLLARGPERQQVTTTSAPKAAEDAPIADEVLRLF
nr:hypothetical protein [Tanacetum cinerariifolium]